MVRQKKSAATGLELSSRPLFRQFGQEMTRAQAARLRPAPEKLVRSPGDES
jgi:hypothetical protein